MFKAMKKLLGLSVGILLGLFSSCGPRYVESWSSSEEFPNAKYEDAWSVVVSTVTEDFNIETIDGASGYLATNWKILPPGCDDLFGVRTGVRVIIRVDSRTPFRLKIKVERGHYDGAEWTITGIDKGYTARLLEKINGRLQKYK
ncbi:MAG: hypothetical protein ACP5QG_03195 [candidate division WOR-3 bacterium]